MPFKKKSRPKKKNIQYKQRAIKIRIFPSDAQKKQITRTFGCCRFVWNKMLSDEQLFYYATDKHFIPTPAKYKNEFPFLKEVDSLALANTQIDIKNAFSKFFAGDAEYPRFKSKKNPKKSYTTNCQHKDVHATIRLVHKGVRLPLLGIVPAKIHRTPMPGWKLMSATVSETQSGKYYCSLLYEIEEPVHIPVDPTEGTSIGLDYSSPNFYVDCNGYSPEKSRWFRASEEKLGKLQRRLTRMEKGSKNYAEQLHRIQVLQEHIAAQRLDFTHKESRRIANAYNAVCVEDINLRAMAGSLHLGKSTNDNGFGMFRNQLEYKLMDQGKPLIKVGKWFPSTKTCHVCGFINGEVVLGVQEWICPSCGTSLLRDHNAAINIRNEGIRLFLHGEDANTLESAS